MKGLDFKTKENQKGRTMKDQIENRMRELQAEFDSGKKAVVELESKQVNIRNTMLRISGAIQVLEELLEEENVKRPEAEQSVNGIAAVSVGAE